MIMTNPLHLQSCVLSVRFMASFVNIYRRLEPTLAASRKPRFAICKRRYVATYPPPLPLFFCVFGCPCNPRRRVASLVTPDGWIRQWP